MKFKAILLISLIMSLNLYAYEPPKNANRAEINCMFISKKFQSQWTKDDWEQCKIDDKATMPHKPVVVKLDGALAVLTFLKTQNNKTQMVLLNTDKNLVEPDIIDILDEIKSVFFADINKKKNLCVINSYSLNGTKSNITNCYELNKKENSIIVSPLTKVLDFQCDEECEGYDADAVKKFLTKNPDGYTVEGS
ncbi:hypothetical protein [Campylobacter concisus]|uniref:hypothetical protein n=1 Tax=Campylobacter concisus TaxID=199 RepID=UPI000D352189|nr:hypothetical protein [Campylobacter concisus]QPH93235.1 hypothetical protein CVT07_01920 [Campylobacter concisus]